MNDLITIFTGLICCGVLSQRFTLTHPSTLFVGMWTVLAALHGLNLLHLVPTSLGAAATVSLGLVAISVGTLLTKPPVASSLVESARPSALVFLTCVVVVSLFLAYGVWSFRETVSASVGGRDFSGLDPSQVLYATAYGRAQGGGLARLLFYTGPLVACMGVYGGLRLNKAWFALVPLALLATSQTPGRTVTFVVVAATVAFYLYIRHTASSQHTRLAGLLPSLTKAVVIFLGMAVLVIAYFNWIGSGLGKNQTLNSAFGASVVPSPMRAPLAYAIGGISALSRAQTLGQDPGEPGRSIYSIMRIGEALGAPLVAPEVVTHYVGIPIPFNVYTGFGDVWFDFGYLGVFIFFGGLGLLLAYAHRRASAGSVASAWAASMLISVLATSAMTIRLFYLDTVVLLFLGMVIFTVLCAPARRSSLAVRNSTAHDPRPASRRSSAGRSKV